MPIVLRRFVVAGVSNSNYAANGAAPLPPGGEDPASGMLEARRPAFGQALLRNFAFPFVARPSCVSVDPRIHAIYTPWPARFMDRKSPKSFITFVK